MWRVAPHPQSGDYRTHVNDQVNPAKGNDLYKIALDRAGRLTANLNGLSGDADVCLIQDKNSNSSIDPAKLRSPLSEIWAGR
jgi:hypothetical protein